MVPIPQIFVVPPPQGAFGGMLTCPLGSALVVSLLLGLLLSLAFIIGSAIRQRRLQIDTGVAAPSPMAAAASANDTADREAA